MQFNYPLDQPIKGHWSIIVPVYREEYLDCLREFLSCPGFPSYQSMCMRLWSRKEKRDGNSVAIRLACREGITWDMANTGWCDLHWYLHDIRRKEFSVLQIHELFSQDAVPADEVNMESLLEMIWE